jgi:sarcosine oxidase subunit delta
MRSMVEGARANANHPPTNVDASMQIFPCPFCGPRDEIEFHYVGEPKARPEPARAVSDAEWADYLWFNANPKGEAREIWLHLTCREMFAMTRDTATNAVIGSEALMRPVS